MLKESLTNSQVQTKKSRKGFAIFALVGACALALGLIGTFEATQTVISDEAAHAHLQSLIEHHSYLQNQENVIGELIEEGIENQIAITGALAAISAVQAAAPVIKGVAGIWKNVVWGEKVVVRTVNPKQIDAAFNDSKRFVAEIKKRFPDSHARIGKLRQDLKIYHFELGRLVMDVQLMAENTEVSAGSVAKRLAIRDRLKKSEKIFASKSAENQASKEKKTAGLIMEVKIWGDVITKFVKELEANILSCTKILESLGKLQKSIKAANDELLSEVDALRKQLEGRKKELSAKLKQLEAKMKSVGCVNNSGELLRAIFTLGIACLFDSPTKKKMMNVKADLVEESTIYQALAKRMFYFDGLTGAAHQLVVSSAQLMKTTREFRQALINSKTELVADFKKEKDLYEGLGDADLREDFEEMLNENLTKLQHACAKTKRECKKIGLDLTEALVGITEGFGPMKEEEEE